MTLIIPCLASFLLTAVLTPQIIRLATACNCLDIPGGRRLHKEATPRWGGAAFFIGVLPFLCLNNRDGSLTAYLAAAALLVVMGMVDDLKSLGWKPKFFYMAVAAAAVIYGGNISVHQIGFYGSQGHVELGLLSIPFTFISIIGITNAINLLDGLNGLAGGVSLLGFLFMGIAAFLVGNTMVAVVCFIFVGALIAFLLYNFPRARIFMGDSGSLFLGFSLAVTALLLTQDSHSSVNSMFPVLVLFIPIFDTLRVLLERLLNGTNPFRSDNLHLHYLLVQNDISPIRVTLLIWAKTLVFGVIALTLASGSSMPYLAVALNATLLLSLMVIILKLKRQRAEAGHLDTTFPAELSPYPIGFTCNDAAGTRFASKEWPKVVKLMVNMGILLLSVQFYAGTASSAPSAPSNQGSSVLERFRTYTGPRTPKALTALLTAPVSPSIRQQPEVVLSDGASLIRISLDAGTPKSTSPNIAFSEAKLISIKLAKADTWDIEALPTVGTWNVSLIVLTGPDSREVQLAVAPRLPAGTDLSEKGFIAFLGNGKTGRQPLLDLNNDGRRDYLDDYIFTANYVAGAQTAAALPETTKVSEALPSIPDQSAQSLLQEIVQSTETPVLTPGNGAEAPSSSTEWIPTSQQIPAAVQGSSIPPAVIISPPATSATGLPPTSETSNAGKPGPIKLAPGVEPSSNPHNLNNRNQRARERAKSTDSAPATVTPVQ